MKLRRSSAHINYRSVKLSRLTFSCIELSLYCGRKLFRTSINRSSSHFRPFHTNWAGLQHLADHVNQWTMKLSRCSVSWFGTDLLIWLSIVWKIKSTDLLHPAKPYYINCVDLLHISYTSHHWANEPDHVIWLSITWKIKSADLLHSAKPYHTECVDLPRILYISHHWTNEPEQIFCILLS